MSTSSDLKYLRTLITLGPSTLKYKLYNYNKIAQIEEYWNETGGDITYQDEIHEENPEDKPVDDSVQIEDVKNLVQRKLNQNHPGTKSHSNV